MTAPARRAAEGLPDLPAVEPTAIELPAPRARRAWAEEPAADARPRRAAEPLPEAAPRRAAPPTAVPRTRATPAQPTGPTRVTPAFAMAPARDTKVPARDTKVPATDTVTPTSRPWTRPWRIGLLAGSLSLVIAASVAAAPEALSGLSEQTRLSVADAASGLAPAAPAPSTGNDRSVDAAPLPSADRPDRNNTRAPLQELPPASIPAPVPAASPAPVVPPPPPPAPKVIGIPNPCSIDLPITDKMSAAMITEKAQQRWGFTLTGSQWRDNSYRPVVKLFAETLDALDCTDYLQRVKAGSGGRLEINSGATRSWAWGDYGLTRAGILTLDFAKFKQGYADGDRGRLVRLIVHEMAHSLNTDRDSNPTYWKRFNSVWANNGPVSAYGSTPTESFADAVGYYVARCAAENPYAGSKNRAYYDYVRTNIFAGREFGGPPGTRQSCDGEGR